MTEVTLPTPATARTGPRILIVRLGAIGDVINSTVLLHNLRRQHPDAFIAWAVHPLAAPMIQGNPDLDEVLVIPRDDVPWGLLRWGKRLAQYRFDIAIDMQKLFKSGLLTWLSGAPRRLGYDRGRAKELSWLLTTEKLERNDPRRHVVDQVLEFATALGIQGPEAKWSLPVHEADRVMTNDLLRDHPGRVALVCLGASEEIKRWYPDRFTEVIEGLHARHGLTSVLVAGKAPVELAMVEAVKKACRVPLIDSAGRGGFRQLLGLMERARLFIGGDTGPLHLAAAFGVPTVGLYGPQDPRRSGPYGFQDDVVFKRLACAPCMKSTCRFGTIQCMKDITAADVLASADRLLARTS